MNWSDTPRSMFAQLPAIVRGSGPTVLMLHGVGLRAEAWMGQIDAVVQAGYHVIAPDMLGHGANTTVGPDHLAGFAAPLIAALDQPVCVVGHSMGALLAIHIAAKRPDVVCGVVPMNGIFQRPPSASKAVQERADQISLTHAPDPAPTLHRWFADKPSPQRVACERWLTRVDPAGYAAAYRTFAHDPGPQRDDLMALNAPALFMTGAAEPNSTPAMSRAMADLAPKGQAIIIDDAAHMMPMTHAGQVNQHLIEFLNFCPFPQRT